jgi:hypothetical protein
MKPDDKIRLQHMLDAAQIETTEAIPLDRQLSRVKI